MTYAQMYPTLSAEDLANAWSYYGLNQTEIHAQIVENQISDG